jgi:hypothetical protein
MSNRWPGGIINGTAPVSTGGGAGDSAPGVWTLDQADQYIAVQEWPGTGTPDPQFQYVTALLHGDGTNGGQNNTFLDSSPNNFSITRNGNTTQGSFSPYGSLWSVFQPNVATDFCSFATGSGTAFQFPGDFTVEAWVLFPTSTIADHSLYVSSPDNNSYFALNIAMNTGLYNLYLNANGISSSISSGIVAGQWAHVAMVRSGSTITMYTNGVSRGTVSNSSTLGYASPSLNRDGGGNPGPRYVSNLRIVKGTAVYTSAFTPSTTPLTAISGTSLLTCQSNRFIDNSTNNYTQTVNGTPSVQRFSPFQNLATYQPAVIGGSGYFDGSGDYLSTASQAALGMGSGDFTYEAWIYVNEVVPTNALRGLFDSRVGGATGCGIYTSADTGTTSKLVYTTNSAIVASSTNTIRPYAWTHVAVTRSGGTVRGFLNGVLEFTVTDSRTFSSSAITWIGADTSTSNFNGFINSARILKGTALYTSAFTPNTSPLTNITNTSLLCNFTNGAIFDSDASNNIETVGNAQVSTAVVKYGTGSMAFDGTGDYLVSNAASTDLYAFGSGNFTIEMWVYFNTVSGDGIIYDCRNAADSTQPVIYRNAAVIQYYTNSANRITSGTLAINTWYHVAVSRAGTSTRMFINGNQVGTYADSTVYTCGVQRPMIGAAGITGFVGTVGLNGYVDDLRITKGYARYWFNFQPPTRAFPNYGGTEILPPEDPLFENVTLLLNGNGTNGAQNNTFLDSSTNNFTITRNGNTTQGSFSPYGTLWSNFFNGSNYLSLASTSGGALDLSSVSTFTIEAWVYTTAYNTEQNGIITNRPASGSFGFDFRINPSGTLQFYYTGFTSLTTTATVPLNTWSHIAVTRSGANLFLFINGALSATSTTFSNGSNTAQAIWVGNSAACAPGAGGQLGYISNLRLLNGTALYTSAFTPSTTPLTAITNTQLLTCQSNRFIDNSSSARAITLSGTPSVQRFSPFEPTAPYSTSVIGGSGYFDGAGDYLTVSTLANTDLDLSGTFTVDLWYYSDDSSNNTTRKIFCKGGGVDSWSDSAGLQYQLFVASDGNLYWQWRNSNSPVNISASAPSTKGWNHIAIGRNGTTTRVWVNGSSIGSSTTSYQLPTTRNVIKIGSNTGNTENVNGYISNLRVVNGTDVYGVSNTTITVPTAPLTAVTDTKLLTNYINAGIPDLAMINNLETVGNAQVSTAQSKFGGSSLAFDGSGDWLSAPPIPQTNFGSGDFTIECWLYRTASGAASDSGIASRGAPGNTNGFVFGYTSSNVLTFNFNYSGPIVTGSTAIPINTWTHVSVTRNGNTFRLFVNGAVDATATSSNSQNTNASDVFYVGRSGFSSDRIVTGFINDLRITNGIARYVQPFTPPTQAFQTY